MSDVPAMMEDHPQCGFYRRQQLSQDGQTPGIGHNAPADPFEALSAEIKGYTDTVAQWLRAVGAIKSQFDCDTARNMQAKCLELARRSEADRESAKAPHLLAGRAVDAKFKPLKDGADSAARDLKQAFSAFMLAEDQRRRDEAAAETARLRAAAKAEADRTCRWRVPTDVVDDFEDYP